MAITSDRVSSEGIIAGSGMPSVLTRVPSACWTTAYSPWPPLVKPWWSQTEVIPARQCGQVLSQCTNGTTTKSPAEKSRTSAPTSATTPTISWPIGDPGSIGFSPR